MTYQYLLSSQRFALLAVTFGIPGLAAGNALVDLPESALRDLRDIAIIPVMTNEIILSGLRHRQAEAMSTRSLEPFGDWQGQYALDRSAYQLVNRFLGGQYDGQATRFSLTGQHRMNPNWRIGGSTDILSSNFSESITSTIYEIEGGSVTTFMLFDIDRYHSSGALTYSSIRFGDLYRGSQDGDASNLSPAAPTTRAVSAHISTYYDFSFAGGNWQYGPLIDIIATKIQLDEHVTLNPATGISAIPQSWRSRKVNAAVFTQFTSDDATLSFTLQMGLLSEQSNRNQTILVDDLTSLAGNQQITGYIASRSSVVSAMVNLTYSPSAVSRISVIYHSLTGDNKQQQALAVGLTFHL